MNQSKVVPPAQNIDLRQGNEPDGVGPAMKVSVIIPTFNRSKLVVDALESALQQTHPDCEIIVIDDGSTDDTAERLAPYRDRIQYFYQENQGASAAQNKGIEMARGEWISILASDDVWLPSKLESQFKALAELGKEFGACFTDCSFIGDPAMTLSAFQQAGLQSPSELRPLNDPVKYILAKYPALFVQSMLVLRSLVEKVNRFDPQLVVGEDTDLLFRLSFHTRFCVLGKPLVKIDRSNGHSRLVDSLTRKEDVAVECVVDRYKKWLRLPDLTDQRLRRKLRADLRELYYCWAITKIYQFEFADALKKIRELQKTGHSLLDIIGTLLFRATRKMLSSLSPAKKTSV